MFFFSSLNSTQFRIENGERGKRAEDKERSGKRFREIQRERERNRDKAEEGKEKIK